jgi:hypothetical protein
VSLERFFMDLSPDARVATAIAPFLAALVIRLVFGKNSWTRGLLSIATTWFAVNALMAPLSPGVREEILRLFR